MKILWKNCKGRMSGRKKKKRFWIKTEGKDQREGEAWFLEPDCLHSSQALKIPS